MTKLKNIVKQIVDKNKTQKIAVTLAEVMIVVVIVAIVGLVFMAMPKKEVKKMDKVKYYTAYTMLKRLADEELADKGYVPLNADGSDEGDDVDKDNEKFGKSVEKLLNAIEQNDKADYSGEAILTNGMKISWANAPSTNDYLEVTVDIDGDGNGPKESGKDIHTFYISKDGDVIPKVSSADWLSFRVYTFDNNGNIQVDTAANSVDYNTAKDLYCCYINKTCYKYSSSITTTSCPDGKTTQSTPYFMEAIKPL